MRVQLVDNPDENLLTFFENKIEQFNHLHWEVTERRPLAIKVTNNANDVIGGASARTFGNWLLIDTLWIHEGLRGEGVGKKVLDELEKAAVARGCTNALLDTLNFQARPFYEKLGFKVEWTQQGYPQTGCKYFMTKTLTPEITRRLSSGELM